MSVTSVPLPDRFKKLTAKSTINVCKFKLNRAIERKTDTSTGIRKKKEQKHRKETDSTEYFIRAEIYMYYKIEYISHCLGKKIIHAL